MSLSKLLSEKVETKTITINHGDDLTFTITGRPDATVITRCQLRSKADTIREASHLSKMLKTDIDPDALKMMHMVRECLINDDSEDRERYDIHQIARLATEHGPLYLKLMQATVEVLGLDADDDGEAPADTLGDTAAKNS